MIRSAIWRNFYHFDTVDSTNTKAEDFIKKGIPSGIILADTQTSGQGREGKSWQSTPGNIHLSLFAPADNSFLSSVPLACLCAVYRTVSRYVDSQKTCVKWPNDVLVEKKKICGILCKSVQFHNQRFYIAGIGLNIVTPDIRSENFIWPPSSITDASGKKPSLQEVVTALIRASEEFFSLSPPDIARFYHSLVSWLENDTVRLRLSGDATVSGTISAILPDGSLSVITDKGESLTVATGSLLWSNYLSK